ncbi:hypothetical protein HaLaN_26804, partial [Haematococcus lacustris]
MSALGNGDFLDLVSNLQSPSQLGSMARTM